ncbi:YkgJ family cysteine cluster protein [Myxococcota bacterium]
MNLVKDPKRVSELGKRKEELNWEFRSFLKGIHLKSEELDRIVHSLHEEVSAQIDCTACGQCCRAIRPLLMAKDLKRLANHLGLTETIFTTKYLMEPDDQTYVFRDLPCPFLQDNRCIVYDARPDDCRSYPHLHQNDFACRLANVCDNCSLCPIVYNVFEFLKEHLKSRRVKSWCPFPEWNRALRAPSGHRLSRVAFG